MFLAVPTLQPSDRTHESLIVKESISKQVIRLLRDMIAAMRSRDESLREMQHELHATGERLQAVENELDDVKTELATVSGQLSQLLDNQQILMKRLLKGS